MGDRPVVIIGAGISGLAAADCLSDAGREVLVVEARERSGGRIHSVYPDCSNVPIELGAEFIHGDRNEVWDIGAGCSDFQTTEVPDRHWEYRGGRLIENDHFWEDLESVMEKFEEPERDQSFNSFLRRTRGVPSRARSLARDYVEGFHAAEPDAIGVIALTKSEEASAKTNGQRAFHVANGYSSLVQWMMERLESRGVRFQFNTVVRELKWKRHEVHVAAREWSHTAAAAVITVPLGTLQQPKKLGGIALDPPLPEKEDDIAALRMGNITKLVMCFHERIWPAKVTGFIHVHDGRFPTCWIDERGPVLVAWAGGPKAESFTGQSKEVLVEVALNELAKLFHKTKKAVAEALQETFWHDWRSDPFSRGAYSYVPAGATHAVARLADPVEDTLFFAGEATASPGEQGTVHGAIGSGLRAAQQLLA